MPADVAELAIRAAFRALWAQAHVGSTPTVRIKIRIRAKN